MHVHFFGRKMSVCFILIWRNGRFSHGVFIHFRIDDCSVLRVWLGRVDITTRAFHLSRVYFNTHFCDSVVHSYTRTSGFRFSIIYIYNNKFYFVM